MNERQRLNQGIIDEFRANAGTVGGQFASIPLLLLTTTGAKSGEPRTTPLAYVADGTNYVISAGNGGRDMHPGWFHNLLANPLAEVEVGTDRFMAHARVAEGAERERLFGRMIATAPMFAGFRQRTAREIPMVVLERAA
jgi:deazaflavin-dependent oxidoreductase (nitroreductase family)